MALTLSLIPFLLAYPSSKIFVFDETSMREDKYENLEHFSVTRDFLNNYKRRLDLMLDN
jgi:predicted ATPase